MFRLFLANKQCKHIIFAGLHDNGYLNILKPYEHDSDISSQITLLETLPAESGFKALGLRIVSFDNVFRTKAFDRASSPPRKFDNPRPASIISPITTLSPNPTPAGLPPFENPSWATATKTGAQNKVISIAPAKSSTPGPPFYFVNNDQQRVDEKLPFLKASDREEFRIFTKTTKVCNQFYLGDYCPKKADCPFSHKKKLSPGQLLALRHQARNIGCKDGLGCYDETCYLGHSCPTEVRLGSGHCDRADDCYFYKVHGVDLVSTLSLFSD
jgi:hypothetical protein